MTFNLTLKTWRCCGVALLLAILVPLKVYGASGSDRGNAGGQCWQKPSPETLQEMLKTAGNRDAQQQAQAKRGVSTNAILLISNTTFQAAYSAGLIVGWGETGDRPLFVAVTAAGTGALIAPFAFIGPAGDAAIADIFNCDAKNLGEVADRAATFLNESVLAEIARAHDAGRRLLIALPGAAGRDETVWDFGPLAKSHNPGALALARDILRASIGRDRRVAPDDKLKALGKVVPRNVAFQELGAGQEFLLPPQLEPLAGMGTRYFLIHNESLSWDESAEYIRVRNRKSDNRLSTPSLMPGYDIVQHALATKGSFRYASPKSASGLTSGNEFNLAYQRTLFRHTYRLGRMGGEWTKAFPGLTRDRLKRY